MNVLGVLVDGVQSDQVSALDRGLSYGDGLFETVRFVGPHAPLWPRHMQRLSEGCRRLDLPMPAGEVLLDEARAALTQADAAVVRITLTRGLGERGYAPPSFPQVCRIVAAFAAPPPMQSAGLRLRTCALRLAEQPALAGIKHLNRLEHVLARAEWSDPAIDDGLLLDTSGRVICATAANLFFVLDGRLVTPALARCGVAGVARAQVLIQHADTLVRDVWPAELEQASELMLTSSVRGVQPVCRLDDKIAAPGPVTRALQRHWLELGFPMEQA